MKKVNVLFFFLFIMVGHLYATDDSKKPILGAFTLGMTPEVFQTQYHALLEKYEVAQKDGYESVYPVSIGGVSMDMKSLGEDMYETDKILNDLYKVSFQGDEPLFFCGSTTFSENKLSAVTIIGYGNQDATISYIISRNPLKIDAEPELVCCDYKAHNDVLEACKSLTVFLQGKYGVPTKTYTIPQMPSNQEVGDQQILKVKFVQANVYGSVVPYAEWKVGDMQVVVGIKTAGAEPFIMFYDAHRLSHSYLNNLLQEEPLPTKELNW